jgi:hypothetical protein
MATSRPFAYNPSFLTLSGTINVGNICIGVDPLNVYVANYGGLTWWNGPDEDLGFIIVVPVPSNTQPTPYPGVFASIGFWGTEIFGSPFSDATFINLVNGAFGQTFTTISQSINYLSTNGYWTNYLPSISNTDAYNYALKVVLSGGFIDDITGTALDVLFGDLQNQNLQSGPSFYSALEGFYPMLGLTSATQAINGNGNTAYDLQFYGGWTFSSLGMQGNGINTQAYTGKDYLGITGDELDNTHFSIYGTVPNNSTSNGDLALNGTLSRWATITLNKIGGGGQGRYEYDCGSGSDSVPNLNSGDFVTISTQGGTTYAYENGAAASPSSAGSVTYVGYGDSSGLYLGVAFNGGGGCPFGFGRSVNTFGWSSFGGFMSTLDMATYQTIVNTFMTSIGRNTY